jgi:hypothetical protein
MSASFCWEHPDEILVFDDDNLHRVHDQGKIDFVSRVDFFLTEYHILSVENNVVNIFGTELFIEEIDTSKERRPGPGLITGHRPYLVQINLATKKSDARVVW